MAKKQNNARRVISGVANNGGTRKEGRGVVQNLRAGGSVRKEQLTHLRSILRNEGVADWKRKNIMDAARAVHPPRNQATDNDLLKMKQFPGGKKRSN